jgi:hypothetical protein
MAQTVFTAVSRTVLCLIPKRVLIYLAGAVLLSAPTALLADALSSNTLSLQLTFTPAQANLFGYSDAGAFDVNNLPVPPGGNNGSVISNPAAASLTLIAPQDVISASPDNTASKLTSATMGMRLANLSGSGDGSDPAQPYNPMLMGTFTYDLNDSAVDHPPFDLANSAYFVTVTIGGVVAFNQTLTAMDPQNLSGTVIIPIPNIVLPANSVTALVVSLGLSANVASSTPPAPPPPPLPPPMAPQYPADPIPEPSTLVLASSGLVWVIRRGLKRG